jgi:hypothetical protein
VIREVQSVQWVRLVRQVRLVRLVRGISGAGILHPGNGVADERAEFLLGHS